MSYIFFLFSFVEQSHQFTILYQFLSLFLSMGNKMREQMKVRQRERISVDWCDAVLKRRKTNSESTLQGEINGLLALEAGYKVDLVPHKLLVLTLKH